MKFINKIKEYIFLEKLEKDSTDKIDHFFLVKQYETKKERLWELIKAGWDLASVVSVVMLIIYYFFLFVFNLDIFLIAIILMISYSGILISIFSAIIDYNLFKRKYYLSYLRFRKIYKV